MKSFVLQPTDTAQWHALVNEAQQAAHLNLDEVVESYLVFMLMRFADRPELAAKIMALEFLEAQIRDRQQHDKLRDVGDQCLLFSGLFPQIAERRMVRVSYFVKLGRSAYEQLASIVDRESNALYSHLAHAFVAIMDVLQAMRSLSGEPALSPLSASELWSDTGSRNAGRIVSELTGSLPVAMPSKNRH